jgi:hypothetical protein
MTSDNSFDSLVDENSHLKRALNSALKSVAHQKKLVRALAEEAARIDATLDPDDIIAWAKAKVREERHDR